MAMVSIVDKIVAAVKPTESPGDRAEARRKARTSSTPGDWLSLILDHHVQLEDAFARARSPKDSSRAAALKHLGVLLTGHAIAEESVIYPAMAAIGAKGSAGTGYDEQATVKVQMAELEKLAPEGQAFLDQLESIRRAVAHHMYEEESSWFPELKHKTSAENQAHITQRYREEFDRYVGGEHLTAHAA
jgi:hemerythrin superfamily protein